MIKNEFIVTVCGPVDAGKSTTIGVLVSGELDDGKGLSRDKILVHPHERESGRTSHMTFNPLIYQIKNSNNTMDIKHYIFSENKKKDGKKILKNTIPILKNNKENYEEERIVSFVDLAGHEKYLKTTVFGVSGVFPNFGMIMIASNTGVTKLTREHIGILFYLKIPFIICITKIDMTPKHVYQQLCNRIKKILSNKIYQKISYFINTNENEIENIDKSTDYYINNLINDTDVVPIISISNKGGENIKNLHKIISLFPKHQKFKNIDSNPNNLSSIFSKSSVVYIDSNFLVPGIGLVVSGSVKGKSIKVKDKMYLGPKNGLFYQVVVRSMHNSISQNIDEAVNESQSCFGIKFTNPKQILERNDIKKGMVLIDNIDVWKSNIVLKFKASITVLQHSTTIKNGYSPIIHCGPIRQSAKLKMIEGITNVESKDEESFLRSGDTKNVIFTFCHRKEFIENDSTFFFMDGNTKGVGKVYELIN